MYCTNETYEEEAATTAELVVAAQGGDPEAFGELVERYSHAVLRIIKRRLSDEADAEEVRQEVFLQAMRKLHQLREPLCFGGWLRSMAARMAINRIARRRVPTAVEPGVIEATAAVEESPLSLALGQERRREVHAGLSRLRRLDRETLQEFYFEGQSLAQMSDRSGAPIGTIKRRLHMARKRLAVELADLATVP